MAKAKSEGAKPKGRGRPRGPTGAARPVRVAVRASEAWRDWVEAFAAHQRITAAELIDRALVEHARAVGFNAAAPRR